MARRMRLSMFWKFVLGNALLAGLLITGGLLVVRSETQMKSRGNYLEKHYARYVKFQAGMATALAAAADRLAHDPRVRADLGAMPSPQSAPNLPTARQVAAEEYELLSTDDGLKPDLVLVFGAGEGELVYASPDAVVGASDLRQLEPVARLRAGSSFFDKLLVHRGAVLHVAGVPVRAPDSKQVVGGVIVGVDVTRLFLAYKDQSDDDEPMQYRLALVHDGKVVASVFPREEWTALGQALDPQSYLEVKEGDIRRQVVQLGAKRYFDFYAAPVQGFAGMDSGDIGRLFLMRSRKNLADREEPAFPVKEAIIGAALSLVIALGLWWWITRPIKRFVRQSQRMLDGRADLQARIDVGSRDEVQDLADNITQVFSRLHALARDVQNASFQVGASSAEISAASKQMLSGLKDQTFKIEGSTAAVTELSASIQQVASNAVEATKVAEKSNVAVTSAVDRMQQIRSTVDEAAARIHELGESGKRIGNIVEVIRQISEQTSLLALNASIEAAHAGEQGRGFAVVADEVSSLARRVGQSAKDIEGLIQTIKEQTSDAVRSMQTGTTEVVSGTRLVTETLHDLKQLIDVVKDTAVAVQEQAVVSDEIARNMDAVQKIATEMVAGSEEAVVQGDQLHELAFQLEQSVGGFNLDGGKERPRLQSK